MSTVQSLISKWEKVNTKSEDHKSSVPLVKFVDDDDETEFPELMTIGIHPLKNIITREMRKNNLLLDITKPFTFWLHVDKPPHEIFDSSPGPFDQENKPLLGFVWNPSQLTSCKESIWYSSIIYYTDAQNYHEIFNRCGDYWTFCFDLSSKQIDNVYHITCSQCELD